MKKFGLFILGVFLIFAFACSKQGSSQKDGDGYPNRQIELVVPFAAGGGVDLAARAVSEYLSEEWDVSIVVVNKTGGGGIVGAQYVLKDAKPDGYTVLMNNNSSTTMYEAGAKDPILTIDDHVLAARVAQSPLVYAVKADAPWNDLAEFTEWVKENPEELTWASVGPAGFSSFGVAEWLDSVGVDYAKTQMVSSEGASDSTAKVAGGHVILAVHNAGEVYSLVQAGKLKVLAVQAEERHPLYPDVPTTKELGFENLTVSWWTGISFPEGTPESIVKKWDETIKKMQEDENFLLQLEKINLQQAYLNSEDFTKMVSEETAKYKALAEQLGIRKQ